MPPLFELRDAVCGYSPQKPILRDISFSVAAGEVLCILGPNGVGKSTLFKSMLALIPMLAGTLSIDGEDIRRWSRTRVARKVAYIPQSTTPPFSYTVLDFMLMGRTAYLGPLASPKKEDEDLAFSIAEELGIVHLVNRRYLELSGGERQLAMIGRALTQQPEIMIMDEPTAALDFGNQQLVLEQVQLLTRRGLAIIMSSHFPDHAFMVANKALMLNKGGIYAVGSPAEVISAVSLRDLYQVDAMVFNTGVASKATGSEIKTCVALT